MYSARLGCDGVVDCIPHGDDEDVCAHVECPKGCTCEHHSLKCSTVDGWMSMLQHATYISGLFELHLTQLGITKQSPYLYSVDLLYNQLTYFKHDFILWNKNLKYLILSNNYLSYIDSGVLCGLFYVDLSV